MVQPLLCIYWRENNVVLAFSVSTMVGFFFSDVDECIRQFHSCHHNAICQNTRGGYQCSCKTGYIREANSCVGEKLLYFISQRKKKDLLCHGILFLVIRSLLYYLVTLLCRNTKPYCCRAHRQQPRQITVSLRTVPTFVSAHTFCALLKAWFNRLDHG